MITIVLADDHQILRQGVRTLLEMEPDFRVVGEAVDGLEACHQIREWKPDVAVLDLMMDGLDGIKTTRWINEHFPQTFVVVLSMYATECYVLEALRAGAKAYVLKQCTSDDLATAIREVVAGNKYVSPPISKVALKIYEEQEPPLASLTARERDIFHFAAQGLTNADIARRLFISPRTVECHRARMMRKLGLHRQAELLLYAIGQGVPLEQIPIRISLDPAAARAN